MCKNAACLGAGQYAHVVQEVEALSRAGINKSKEKLMTEDETSHSIFKEFRKLKTDPKRLQPVTRTVIAFGFTILLIFGLGIAALYHEVSWGSPKVGAIMSWVSDSLMFGSVILGFWKTIELPMISNEREICLITKNRAATSRGILEKRAEKFRERNDQQSAKKAEALQIPIKEGLTKVDNRLNDLKASENFSAKTLRLAIGFAALGMAVKGLSMMFP